jgi:hypothetical protein
VEIIDRPDLLVGFVLLMDSAFAVAQTSADEAAIRQLEFDFEAAWNRHDANALASQLVEDSDFIGTLTTPRDDLGTQEPMGITYFHGKISNARYKQVIPLDDPAII